MEAFGEQRQGRDRRSAYGEILLAAFVAARRPLGFADLVQLVEGRGAMLSDVADWMATARSSGLIVDDGFETAPDGSAVGPRLFVLAPAMRAAVSVNRRRRERRTAFA